MVFRGQKGSKIPPKQAYPGIGGFNAIMGKPDFPMANISEICHFLGVQMGCTISYIGVILGSFWGSFWGSKKGQKQSGIPSAVSHHSQAK